MGNFLFCHLQSNELSESSENEDGDDEDGSDEGSDEDEEDDDEEDEAVIHDGIGDKVSEIRGASNILEHLHIDTSRKELEEHLERFREKEAEMQADAQRGAVKMNVFEDKGDVLIKARGQPLIRYQFDNYVAMNFTSLIQVFLFGLALDGWLHGLSGWLVIY